MSLTTVSPRAGRISYLVMPTLPRLVQPPVLDALRQQLTRLNNPKLFECITATVLPPIPLSVNAPRLPAPRRKAHRNHLHCYFDTSRRLQIIVKFKPMLFPGMVAEYIEATLSIQLPDSYYNSHQASMYTPPKGVLVPSEATVVSHVAEYVYNWALLPIQLVLHSTAPSDTKHVWSQMDNPDQDLMRVYQWRAHGKGSQSESTKMLAFVQAPWVLGERDFVNFVRTKSMPQDPVNRDGKPTELTGKERLWAKIYDECTRNNCRWFVVTTYFHWAFGVFSEGYSAVTITHEFPSPRPGPSVSPLRALYYWLCSSMQLSGAFIPDKFMETPYRHPGATQSNQQHSKHEVFQPSASESTSNSEDDNITTYSRIPHRPVSELSFQSTTISSTPGVLKNVHIPRTKLGAGRESVKLPRSGDSITKEAVLPRRHWGNNSKADCVMRGRQDLKKNQGTNETLDWLEEGDAENWIDGDATTEQQVNYSEIGFGREPPSPNGSSNGSVMGTKVGQAVGKPMFAVAPKHPRRHYDI